ncbi:transposase domain-containing protein [Gigaspora margarita]|uniref:Transposase domain-containing protein n=1 Tax=Gigaspora margarita TaxID=4874 RepID=A0A8H3X6H7_GIGMA|nr:transposase domain-containing protein [Gigaspora margarita]
MRVRCYCPKCKGKFINPSTKEQYSLTTSQQLPQTELNELRQPTLTSELNGLSQQIQISSTKINILDTKEQGTALVNESSYNEIILDYNNKENDDNNDLLSEEELAEDIRYSNINEFEDFLAPNIDYENEFQSKLRVPTSYDNILIWLLKFQSDFKVSKTGTEVLTKYICQLLCEYSDANLFKDFLNLMYMLRKHLKIDNFITYSVCPKCDKLYTTKKKKNNSPC